MTDHDVEAMLAHARSYLRSARRNLELGPEQSAVAFDEARHAAEVAAKALVLHATGTDLGKVHSIGGSLAHAGLIPLSLDEKRVARLFAEHTRGSYGYYEGIDRPAVEEAIEAAERFIAAAERPARTKFHAARSEDV